MFSSCFLEKSWIFQFSSLFLRHQSFSAMHYAGWTCQFSAHADKNAVLTFEIMRGEENSKTHFRSSPIFRYVMALFMIVGGFSSSFIVISYGTSRGGFDYPLKSFALTLAMAMGEFNSRTLYDDFKKKEDEDEKVSRTFAMILLMALILAGTITMLNLFITVIITSKDKLRQSVLEENLFYMAQSSRMIQYTRKLFSKFCVKDLSMNFILVKNTFCVHKICGSKCVTERVP